jgi:hypothetical protein
LRSTERRLEDDFQILKTELENVYRTNRDVLGIGRVVPDTLAPLNATIQQLNGETLDQRGAHATESAAFSKAQGDVAGLVALSRQETETLGNLKQKEVSG